LSTNSRKKNGVAVTLIVTSFFMARLCFLLLPHIFEPWNAKAIDQLFMLRSSYDFLQPTYDNTIVHVDLNNTTIQKFNNFYLNRSHYARVIRNLGEMGTAMQAYDFIFAAPSNELDDAALIDATTHAGNVYFGVAFALSDGNGEVDRQPPDRKALEYLKATNWHVKAQGETSKFFVGSQPLLTFSGLATASRGVGFLSIQSDMDGVFRRAPLLVKYEKGFYPSLPFRVACDYLGVSSENIVIGSGKIVLKKAHKPQEKEIHDIIIPIDDHGNMLMNIIGPWEAMKHYNFADVYRASDDPLEMELWKKELKGKIVVVSDVSTGSTDIGPVPTDINFPLSGLHANVIHTILTENFLKELSEAQMTLLEMGIGVCLVILAICLSPITFVMGSVGLAVAYSSAVALSFFLAGTILHLVRPLFLIGISTALITAYRYVSEEKEKLVLRKSFEAYFPPSVVKKIMANPEMISNKGQKKELTILFSDIKSFTTYSASLTPDEIRRALNEYFEAMVEIVFKYEGTVDKYIGDGLMVFFGDPEPQNDHALRCVRSAIEMQKKVRELKQKWEGEGGIPLQIRIGINTGEVVVGNMGSSKRLSYTVLGSAVNLAQRLESNAPVGGILISDRTHELVKGKVPTGNLREIQVKGIDMPVRVCEVYVE
jgi:adenylate cyclase